MAQPAMTGVVFPTKGPFEWGLVACMDAIRHAAHLQLWSVLCVILVVYLQSDRMAG